MSRPARIARAILGMLRALFAFTRTERFWAVALPAAEIATLLAA